MRKGFWDRQGANIANHYNELYGVQLDFVKMSDLGLRKFIG